MKLASIQRETAYSASRQTLCDCFALGVSQFHRLFSGSSRPLREFRGDISPLIELGLVGVSSREARAQVPIIAFDGLFLKCDAPSSELWERVFPIHDDESLLLARWADVKRGGRVLEIGTGSGVATLRLAAGGADKVIATDINPRVGDYFAFNAELNGLSSRVEYVHSDVFAALDGERFDTIISNPPFVPVPDEARYFLHSDGGPFGTSVLERVATGWRNHILPGGNLYTMAMSLGNSSAWRISTLFPDANFGTIYDTPHLNLDEYLRMFQWIPRFRRWKDALGQMHYDRIGYFGLTIGPHREANLNRLRSISLSHRGEIGATPWTDHSWSMAARLKRYG